MAQMVTSGGGVGSGNNETEPAGPKCPELHVVAPFYAMAVATVIPTCRMITQPVLRLPLSSIIATEFPKCKVSSDFTNGISRTRRGS